LNYLCGLVNEEVASVVAIGVKLPKSRLVAGRDVELHLMVSGEGPGAP
jgi:hypothetical protein